MKNNLKKVLAMLLVLTMLALIGCGAKPAETPVTTVETETAAPADNNAPVIDELIIGMEGNWAPWTYHDDSDKLVGFDVEVGQYIAEYLGAKATFVEGEWDGLLAGVKSGRYTMVINGVDITPDRQEAYSFSDPYAYVGTVLVVAADNTSINSAEDLKGKTTANSIGSTYMEIAESYGATVSGVDTLDETIQMVLQGRVDATLNADQSIMDYLKEHPDAPIRIVCYVGAVNEIAIPMSNTAANASLVAKVNEAIADMRASGKLAEISVKYFGVDISNK